MKITACPDPPVREHGTRWCFLLSLFVHVLLGILLYYGVQWQSSPPVPVEAELWDAIPEATTALPEPVVPRAAPAARPKAVEEADIALQQQQRRHAAAAREPARKQPVLRARRAREAADRQEAARKAAQHNEDAAIADAQRRGELKRLETLAGHALAGSVIGAGTGTGGTTSSRYADLLRRRVKPNIIFSEDVAGNPAAVVAVRLAPDGSLLSARLTMSSGNAAWDSAVLRAVERSEPLPRDKGGIAPASITITFKPKDQGGS